MRRPAQGERLKDGDDGIAAIVVRECERVLRQNSGRGMGARDFAWSALLAEFVTPDARASASYL
jgi:hypothetical protein